MKQRSFKFILCASMVAGFVFVAACDKKDDTANDKAAEQAEVKKAPSAAELAKIKGSLINKIVEPVNYSEKRAQPPKEMNGQCEPISEPGFPVKKPERIKGEPCCPESDISKLTVAPDSCDKADCADSPEQTTTEN